MNAEKLDYLNQLYLDIKNIKEYIRIANNFQSAKLRILYTTSFSNKEVLEHRLFEEIYKRHFNEIVKEIKEVCDKVEREFEEL